MFPDFVEDAHALPHADDGFHVEVRWKEYDEAVWRDFGEFGEKGPVVTDDAGFVADLEAGGHGGLVGAASDDHGEEGVAGEGDAVGFLDNGVEAEHFWVHFERGDGSGGDDDGGEAVEDWFDGDGGVQACEVENWVGDRSSVGFVRLENQEKSFIVRRCKRSECSYFLQWLIIFDVCEFQSPNERG